jgi:hypothetical protein
LFFESLYRLPKRLGYVEKLASFEFSVQGSATICALLAVDEAEVFLAQRLDDTIDVVRGILLQPGPEIPVFVVVFLRKLIDP